MAQTDTAPTPAETPVSTPTPPSKSPADITVRDLLEAGLHFGHQTKRWNPKMKPYIFDKRNGIHIIDLSKSLANLQKALEFVREVVLNGRNILFVGTKKQAQQVVQDVATSCNQHYVTTRWLGGTMTNSPTIRNSVKRMREIEAIEKKDNFASMHKKEASRLRHELEKLRRNLTGVANMVNPPGAVFVVDINREAIAVAEARKLNIPVIAVVDTNCDPDPIKYVIPGNDDATRGVQLIVHAMAHVIRQANDEYSTVAAEVNKRREAEDKAKSEAGGSKPADGHAPNRRPERTRSRPGAGGPNARKRSPAEAAAAARHPRQRRAPAAAPKDKPAADAAPVVETPAVEKPAEEAKA